MIGSALLIAALAVPSAGAPIPPIAGAPIATVVGVRHRDGRHEVKASGALDDGKGPDGDTVFEMGSITKTFTALLYARAIAEGRLTRDATLASTIGSTTTGLTLESLATHTSGLPRQPPNLAPAHDDDPYADYTVERMKAGLASTSVKPCAAVGALVCDVEYSNFGMGALGYAVTRTRGYAKALRDDVVTPLGLTRTSFIGLDQEPHTRSSPSTSRIALPHKPDGTATSFWHQTEATAGAGGVLSTANDLLRVSDALINASSAGAALHAALVDVQTVRRPARDGNNGVALAWSVRADGILWHNGGTGGTSTVWDVDAHSGCAVVILENRGNDAAALDALVNRVLDACLREPAPLEPAPPEPAPTPTSPVR